MKKLYDTCSLLNAVDILFDNPEDEIIITSITLSELEAIKNSKKDFDVKHAARRLTALLDAHEGEYEVRLFRTSMLNDKDFIKMDLEINNDAKILAIALDYAKELQPDKLIFVTNDLALKSLARLFDKWLVVKSVEYTPDDYPGYLELICDENALIDFYQNLNINHFNLLINQYLILKNHDNEVIDIYCWTGEENRRVSFQTFRSVMFGDVKPLKGDVYQTLLADSLAKNRITQVKGPAGSGKTYLSLAYLFSQLERGRIDKIIVFCNTVATKDSAKLGYYPGSRDEKLLDSQIGNLLASKLGGKIEVERLIEDEKLILLPLSDVRGYDTSGMNAGVYLSEAQNMSISLMKLALQRIGEDSICIIDGDVKTQVDDPNFAGANNGMRRVSKVFRNHNIYGEIELKNIHRSKIAEIAENL